MRLKRHGNLLQNSLKQVCLKSSAPHLAPTGYSCRRNASSTVSPSAPQQDIAIVGGGITGLSTAYYLSRGPNSPKVTVYESSKRIGGWLSSRSVDVNGGKVLFEQGPRSLRPSVPRGLNTVALLEEIGLGDEIIYIPKTSPSAQLRWLFYPDHLFSLPVPSEGLLAALPKFFQEPALKGIVWGILTEIFKETRPEDLEDESVGSFLSRRISPNLVNNVVSAVFHGVYAGDVWQLSAKSLMPHQWHVEGEDGSVLLGIPHMMQMVREDDFKLIVELAGRNEPTFEAREKIKGCSVFTLKKGVQQLTDRMESLLRMGGNVEFKPSTAVREIALVEEGRKVQLITDKDSTTTTHDQVISTLFSKTLSKICNSTATDGSPSRTLLPSLSQTHAVSVNVVNLYYTDPHTLPIRGFGYLIPQSVPFDQNPERGLGVVFDSEITTEQDTVPGTKLTVMLGGHWWDGWTSIPNEKESIELAKSLVRRHLNITTEPAATFFSSQKDCIPQYTVGHSQRLKEAHKSLLYHFKGRVKVAGNSYTGVGVNDCLKASLEIASSTLSPDWNQKTGLESFEKDLEYVEKKNAMGIYKDDLLKMEELRKRLEDDKGKAHGKDVEEKFESVTMERKKMLDWKMKQAKKQADDARRRLERWKEQGQKK
ncbi:Protoporphyrinogen oxidase [Tothia fuscella]|uniref:Protoporphyrinogen oxidase n=1 Tax=Tothia fuscella TaxID=1048955 RepID=A0A9P4P2D5_9PEZI|nr:Protoporphyrinogen oxidase [Tothia fuscella]